MKPYMFFIETLIDLAARQLEAKTKTDEIAVEFDIISFIAANPVLTYRNHTIINTTVGVAWFDNGYLEGETAENLEEAKRAIDLSIDNQTEAAYERTYDPTRN